MISIAVLIQMFVEFRHSFARATILTTTMHTSERVSVRACVCVCVCVCDTIYHNNCTLNSVMLNSQDHFVVVVK